MQYLLRDFRDGIGAYFDAVKCIRAHRLWIYLLIPGLISLVFGALVIWGGIVLAGKSSAFVTERYPWEFGAEAVRAIAGFLGGALTLILALYVYKYVVLILVAPFMSPLSERVERILSGTPSTGHTLSAGRALRELIRGLRVSLRNLVRELFFTLLILIATAVLPVLAVFSAPLIFLVQAYYAGFGNMDFMLERHFGVRASVRFVRSCRGLAIGNGAAFLVLLMIPVAGLFLAPGLSTVAGTMVSLKRMPASD